jgi:DNA-binding CsgD family transcriptional regulator
MVAEELELDGVRPDDALGSGPTGFKGHIKNGDVDNWRERKGLPKMRRIKDTLALANRRAYIGMMVANDLEVSTIANDLGITPVTVYKHINNIIDSLDGQAQEGIQRARLREIAIANMVHVEAVNSFFESKEGRIKNSRKAKREVRSHFQKTSSKARLGAVKFDGNDTQLYERQKGNIAALFEHHPQVGDGPVGNAPPNSNPPNGTVVEHGGGIVSLFTGQGQLIQYPVETVEELETHETSPGINDFLITILRASELRCRLLKLFDGEAGNVEEEYAALLPEERRNKLIQLVQDLRHAKAIVDAQEEQAALGTGSTEFIGTGPVIDITPVSAEIPVTYHPNGGNGTGG